MGVCDLNNSRGVSLYRFGDGNDLVFTQDVGYAYELAVPKPPLMLI